MAVAAIGIVHFTWFQMRDGHFLYPEDAQHFSVFVFYGLSGLLHLLSASRIPLPRGTDYTGLLMAFSVQALIFHFHQHNRSPIDVLVHTLLKYSTMATAVCVAIEMRLRQSVLAALGRAFFTILQGTWFIQIAYIVYRPWLDGHSWKDDHRDVMLAVAVYTWHMFGIMLYVAFVGGLTRFFMRGMRYGASMGIRKYPSILLDDSAAM